MDTLTLKKNTNNNAQRQPDNQSESQQKTAPNPPQEKRVGTLVMASTHIGDPKDIPPRTLEWLRSAKDQDLIVFEEDRPARQVLKAAGVQKKYLKFSEHREPETMSAVAKALKKGRTVIYTSDQGTPGLADPGRDLILRAMDIKAQILVVPGPSSITAAIAACPFDMGSFMFLGFVPRIHRERIRVLKGFASFAHPLVILDVPYRSIALLEAARDSFGSSRRAMMARDISGPNESYWVGSLENLVLKCTKELENASTNSFDPLSQQQDEEGSQIENKGSRQPKLNFVLVVDGRR